MSNVDLVIGGRRYTIACADGEEGHIAELGGMIDTMVSTGSLRAQSEQRMLLYAALMLADELHEARDALKRAAPASDPAEAAKIEQRVDQITIRLEALAQHLEDRPTIP
ncbi:cell division protein ZapA [Novosphingobium sp. RD2P27]|uniref:Cell division protein ZapA n=1 Tax=Novosphingobium kalidii TaxID=3230299 RepID=A0ABV2D273_9SPHN